MLNRSHFIAGICASILAIPTPSHSQERSIIVVVDNGATVQDQRGSGTQDRPMFNGARLALVNHFAKSRENGLDVTFISTYQPQVIWSGPARKSNKASNTILAEFINEDISGCVDFTKVAEILRREARHLTQPLSDVYFLSSLIHTTGIDEESNECAIDKDNLAPPLEFFDELALIGAGVPPKFHFHWVFDEIVGEVADRAYDAGLSSRAYGENQTINWLRR